MTTTLTPFATSAAFNATGPAPYEWLTLDLETTNGRPEAAERWCRMQWSPNPNLKADTIGRKYLEALDKKKERLALLDESPVILVTLRSGAELRALHCMRPESRGLADLIGADPAAFLPGLSGDVHGFASAEEMLRALRQLLDSRCARETMLVGHNIAHFDLVKLRWAYLRAGLRAPYCLLDPDQPVFDTMIEYGRKFSLNHDLFVSFEDLLELLELPNHKGVMSGAQVPELHAAGEFDTIIRYGLLDVLGEAELFLRMTGQAANLG